MQPGIIGFELYLEEGSEAFLIDGLDEAISHALVDDDFAPTVMQRLNTHPPGHLQSHNVVCTWDQLQYLANF
jgi:hypothetical protein